MLEIELKAYAEDPDYIIKRLGELGAEKKGTRVERDIYYNHPSRNFKDTDEALRIRSDGDKTILTYKGPKIGDRTKTRYEEEVEICSLHSMEEILLKLGFFHAGDVEKERTFYHVNEIEVCVDRVEGLGDFIELEKKGEDREKGEKDLFELAEELGLERFERRSYLELKLMNKGR